MHPERSKLYWVLVFSIPLLIASDFYLAFVLCRFSYRELGGLHYTVRSWRTTICGRVPIISVTSITSYRHRVALVVALVLFDGGGLYVVLQRVITLRCIFGPRFVQ